MTTRKIFTEEVHEVDLDQIPDHTNHSQHSGYWGLHRNLRPHVEAAQESGKRNTLISCLHELLCYPDHCTQESMIPNPQSDSKILLDTPPLSSRKVYPKEQSLVELVNNEKNEGRRVLVYVAYTTGKRDITTRLRKILAANGHQAATLQMHTPKPSLREEWMKEKVKQGVDALISHPKIVPTGMDLEDFPTVVWFEPKYSSAFTLKKDSIRSWKNDQTLPVRVIHYVYAKTLQQEALRLMEMMETPKGGEQGLIREILEAYTSSEDR